MRLSVEVGEAKYGGDGVGSIDPEGNVDVEYTLICANDTISGQVRSDQIRSDQIRSGQVRWNRTSSSDGVSRRRLVRPGRTSRPSS